MGREHFFTNITHEFRTPLTVILGLGKELTDATTEDTEKIHISAKMIVRQGNSLLQLVNQLLDISKVKSSIGEPDWRTGDITGYMKMAIEGYQNLAKQKNITMVYAPNEESLEMDFVPDYINKIIRNLISNSTKYTRENGNIFITTEQVGNSLKMIVSDNGIGISQKHLPHIFEAFYQADDDSMNIGTGVGLSLVKQIVTAMNGTIEAESATGKGTVFTLMLPMKHGKSKWKALDDKILANHLEMGQNEEMELPEDITDEQDNKPRLLLVEDNHDVAYYIGTQLDKKYNVHFANEGCEGLKKAMEIMPDLIITDLMMPGMGGCELCEKVRSSEILNHIPIIVITAKTTEEDRLKLLKAGADAYLYKPFNSDELNVRIDKLLEQRQMLRAKYSKALSEGKEDEVQLSQQERDFINKFTGIVLSLMKKGNVDVEATAAEMCMSSAQMRRKLSQTTGENPATFILKIRMNHAKKMMDAHPEYSINQVASMCGFEDNSHFSRAFKTVFGISPSQHRKGMI
jgi:DNA-binding response OmpR family regulator/two-component sensor histidine kinase